MFTYFHKRLKKVASRYLLYSNTLHTIAFFINYAIVDYKMQLQQEIEKTHIPGTAPLPSENIPVYKVESGETLQFNRLAPAVEIMARVGIIEHLHSSQYEFHANDIEPPADAEYIQQTAEDFIFRTVGIKVDAPITWQKRSGGTNASYHPLEKSITMSESARDNDTESMRYMELTSKAVHEKAHETSFATRKVWAIQMPRGSDDYTTSIQAEVGLRKSKIERKTGDIDSTAIGSFFEEAFAEETATRWREEAIEQHKQNGHILLPTRLGFNLPLRYFNYSLDASYPGGIMADSSFPAIAAHGLEILSKYSGMDFYQMIVESRHPETEVAAKRRLIQSINAIAPDLYKKLRDVPYTEEGFKEGLQIIKDTVAQ